MTLEYSIDGPMCRWSSSKEIGEVPRGGCRWKRDKRFVDVTGNSETVSDYPASLVVAMLKAIKRRVISDGAIRIGEMHFAGPVPDESDYPTELDNKW